MRSKRESNGVSTAEWHVPGAESTKVLCRLRDDIGAQFHDDTADIGSTNCDIKENLGVGHCVYDQIRLKMNKCLIQSKM